MYSCRSGAARRIRIVSAVIARLLLVVRRPAGVVQTIGSVGGWLTLAALPLVGLALAWWRRQPARTRAQLRLLHAQQAEVAGVAARAAGVAPPAGPGTLSRECH